MVTLPPELIEKLARFLAQHEKSIIQEWVNLVSSIDTMPYQRYPRKELETWCREGLQAVQESLESKSYNALEQFLHDVTLRRIEQGFLIQDGIQGLFLSGEIVSNRIQTTVTDREEAQYMSHAFDQILHRSISRLGALYADTMKESLDIQQMQTARKLEEAQSLQQVTVALLEKVDLKSSLQVVVNAAKNLTNSANLLVYQLEEENLKLIFSYIDDVHPDPSFNTEVITHAVTGGQMVIEHTEQFLPEEENHLHVDQIAIPYRVKEKIIGVLAVLSAPGGFDEDDIRILASFSDQVALCFESTRLHEDVERLAVLEERQRLARELHDSVTQELYGVTLYAEAAARTLEGGDLKEASDNLRELRDTAREALKEMRLLIYELRPPILEQEGLVAALQTRLEAVEGRAGLKTEFHSSGEVHLPFPVEEVYYRIAQEALNNSLKHANANVIGLSIVQEGSQTRMDITDNGIGFDAPAALINAGMGLDFMYDRSKKIGANLILDSKPGNGSHLILTWSPKEESSLVARSQS